MDYLGRGLLMRDFASTSVPQAKETCAQPVLSRHPSAGTRDSVTIKGNQM